MKEYRIRIEEVLRRDIIINAGSIEEALEEVELKYYDSEIILDSSDYYNTEFKYIGVLKDE